MSHRIQSVTPVNSITYDNLGLEYHRIPPGLMFGYERHTIGESYCFIATVEKAEDRDMYEGSISCDAITKSLSRKEILPLSKRFATPFFQSLVRYTEAVLKSLPMRPDSCAVL